MSVEIGSSATRENPSLPSNRYRFLEWFVFILALSYSVSGLGTVVGGGRVSVTFLFALPILILTLASFLVIPLLVYWDTRLVRSQDFDWKPRPVKWALIVFVLTPLTAVFTLVDPSVLPGLGAMRQLHAGLAQTSTPLVTQSSSGVPALGALVYLFYRHRHLSPRSTVAYWWLLPGGVVLAAVIYLVAAMVIPRTSIFVLTPTLVLSCLFPIGIYLDSIYLRSSEYSWKPNPALQFFLAFLSISVFPLSYLYPLYFAIYMTKRRSARP